MKILLFGKGGQVGWELQRSLAVLGDLVAVDFDSTDLCGDFSRPDAVISTVRVKICACRPIRRTWRSAGSAIPAWPS